MRNKLLVYLLFITQSSLLYCQQEECPLRIPILECVEDGFIQLVNQIINQEKACDYYTDSLNFYVSIIEHPLSSNNLHINIFSEDDINVILELNPIAILKYKDHTLFIYDYIPKILFNVTNNVVPFVKKRDEQVNTENLISSDDSHSFWLYLFEENKFQLLEHFSWCD